MENQTPELFKLSLVHDSKSEQILNVGFNPQITATNAEVVPYVVKKLQELSDSEPMRGRLLKVTGVCSIPVAYAIAHKVNHLYGAIAVFDPKVPVGGGTDIVGGYVVVITHDPKYKIGDVLTDEAIIV